MSRDADGLYGMRRANLNRGIDLVSQDLNYLCSLIEHPDPEFIIMDAVIISAAIVALANQLDFMADEISSNPISDDGDFVKLSKEEVTLLNDLSEEAEASVERLEELCKISLKKN